MKGFFRRKAAAETTAEAQPITADQPGSEKSTLASILDHVPLMKRNAGKDAPVLELVDIVYDPAAPQPPATVLDLVDRIDGQAPDPATPDEKRSEPPPLDLVLVEGADEVGGNGRSGNQDMPAESASEKAVPLELVHPMDGRSSGDDESSEDKADESKPTPATDEEEPGDAQGAANEPANEPDRQAAETSENVTESSAASLPPLDLVDPIPPSELPPVSPPPMPVANASSQRMINIDMAGFSAAGMVTPNMEWSQTAEEFRIIKRPLIQKALEKNPGPGPSKNLIMVTSSRPGEGKTFCAVNLAMSIAQERDLTVLLVDGDIAKPSIPDVLGFQPDLGLIDLIADDSLEMSDVLLRTNIPNLAVLPAGQPHQLATELLASERMDRFVNELATRYNDRIVIFDSPPALLSSIPSVLSLYVGQLVFVVQADKSTQAMVDAALSIVSGCENMYLLLNQARHSAGAEKFEGYYGQYGYGQRK